MPISFVTPDDLHKAVAILNERITQMAHATQQDIDNLTTQVGQVATDLASVRSTLQAEIDSLAGYGVDVTNLQSAVAPLDAAVKSLSDLQPTSTASPAPPADTTPPAPTA